MSFPAPHFEVRAPLRSLAKFRLPWRGALLRALCPLAARSSLLTAFTLVELLVVVAIIAILAALLMPSLKTARDRSKALKCVSNLRQIGVASKVCAGEHDGDLFPSPPLGNRPQALIDTYLTGRPFVTDRIFSPCWTCPSRPNASTVRGTTTFWADGHASNLPKDAYDTDKPVYPINSWMAVSSASVRNQGQKVYFFESDRLKWIDETPTGGGSATGMRGYNATPSSNPQLTTWANWGYAVHFGGMNILFCDGHVEWTSVNSPIINYWSPGVSGGDYWSP